MFLGRRSRYEEKLLEFFSKKFRVGSFKNLIFFIRFFFNVSLVFVMVIF